MRYGCAGRGREPQSAQVRVLRGGGGVAPKGNQSRATTRPNPCGTRSSSLSSPSPHARKVSSRVSLLHGYATRTEQQLRHEAGPKSGDLDSVMLVPSDATDVVPGGRLVAPLALLDTGVRLPGDRLRHHLEVHHGMAGRRQVALRAIGRTRRRVAVSRDAPRRGRVALRTVGAHLAQMTVLGGVARGAGEQHFRGSEEGRFRARGAGSVLRHEPASESAGMSGGGTLEFAQTDGRLAARVAAHSRTTARETPPPYPLRCRRSDDGARVISQIFYSSLSAKP